MILELHSHTAEHSACSYARAVDLVRQVVEKGIEGIVLTEHQYLWPPDELEKLRREAAVPRYFVILSGQEISTLDGGHILVYGADTSITEVAFLASMRERYPKAAFVWAHPYREENIPSVERLLDPMLEGVEIFSSNHTVSELNRALRDWHRYKFTAIGGTDTHSLSYAGTYPTIFDHPVTSMQELVDELRHGRCRPFFKEIPRAGTTNTKVTEVTLGTKGTNGGREKIIIKEHENAESWKSAERTFHIMEALSKECFKKGQYRIPKPLGRDSESLILIEQGIRGKSLFERLLRANKDVARTCLRMSAFWLAKLHNCRPQVTPPGEFMENEPKRLSHYLSALYRINHKHTRRAQEIMDMVLRSERELLESDPRRLVQGHGDFHPKNIFIGQDDSDNPDTTFVAVVDFGSSYTMPAAFDVGTFLAQFRNQFYSRPDVFKKVPEETFVENYLRTAEDISPDFLSQVELFKARTSLSILYLLVKVGLGESEDLWRVLVEAEHSISRFVANSSRDRGPA